MKTRILFITIFLFISIKIYGQVGEYKKIMSLGFNSSFQLNKIGFEPTVMQSNKLGYGCGIVFRLTSEKYFSTFASLQLESNFNNLGWKERIISEKGVSSYISKNINYLQIPLLTKLAWGNIDSGLSFFVLLGPQVSFKISESILKKTTLYKLGLNDKNISFNNYIKPNIKKFDYGLIGGLGIELSTKIGHFDLDARYQYSLSDIYSNSKRDVFSRSNHKTFIFKFSYLFDFIKK